MKKPNPKKNKKIKGWIHCDPSDWSYWSKHKATFAFQLYIKKPKGFTTIPITITP